MYVDYLEGNGSHQIIDKVSVFTVFVSISNVSIKHQEDMSNLNPFKNQASKTATICRVIDSVF